MDGAGLLATMGVAWFKSWVEAHQVELENASEEEAVEMLSKALPATMWGDSRNVLARELLRIRKRYVEL